MFGPIGATLWFTVVGVTFVLLGLPLKHEKVPPNWFYGFRTPKTLSSNEIWYAVNRVAGIDMIRAGVVITAVSLILLGLRNWIAPEAAIFALLTVSIVMAMWMVIHGFAVLRRM